MSDDGTVYWIIVAAVGGAIWTLVTAIRERRSKALEQSHAIMDRLLEGDKLLVQASRTAPVEHTLCLLCACHRLNHGCHEGRRTAAVHTAEAAWPSA